jgi:hypothetical protein
MSRVKQPDRQFYSIIPEIRKKDFIKNYEDWWRDCYPKTPLLGEILFQISIPILKKFQKKKSPEFLGNASRVNPYLIEHPLIRAQLILWINEMGHMGKATNKAKENITLFCKGLIPNTRRTLKLEELPVPPEAIRKAYDYMYQVIKDEFSKGKPKTRDERASILKGLFEDKKILHIDRFCEKWALDKEPRKITQQLILDTLHLVYIPGGKIVEEMVSLYPQIKVKDPYKIGLNALKSILKKSV